MVEKYSKRLRITSYDSDQSARLKPASFLNLAQEAANLHADYLGVGYDTITETRKAWVLARTHVIFHRLPAWREEVTLKSWHKRANGFQYYRDFEMLSEEGERIVSATTTWLVINIDTRRMVRQNDFGEEGILGIDEDVIEEPAPKVAMPRDAEAEAVGAHDVAFSDLDMNGHVNNVNYAVWAMDSVGLDVTLGRPLRELVINYNSEIKQGDRVELFRLHTSEGSVERYFIEGRVEGRVSFVAQLDF
ncbi:MAG: hypothetical protein IKA70_02335 [Alistipes sp.]|nr:hypothetical protein [Alistipes sp.]